jgi:hypothetical protein
MPLLVVNKQNGFQKLLSATDWEIYETITYFFALKEWNDVHDFQEKRRSVDGELLLLKESSNRPIGAFPPTQIFPAISDIHESPVILVAM